MLDSLFRKKEPKRYFALVLSDRKPDGFKFTPDKDCKMFMVTGEIEPGVMIPRTVLRSAVDKFDRKPTPEQSTGEIKISEKRL